MVVVVVEIFRVLSNTGFFSLFLFWSFVLVLIFFFNFILIRYHSIPPITKWYMTGCLLTTVAVQLELISPYDLWLNFVAIWHDFEVWRLVTNFLFFGYLDLNFVFYMYFMVRHSRSLEDTTYRGRSADYFFLWLFSAGSLLLIAFLFVHYGIRRMNFLASSLTSVIVYVWSKHNPHLRMSFLYLFTFSAPWLPWVILLLGWFLGQVKFLLSIIPSQLLPLFFLCLFFPLYIFPLSIFPFFPPFSLFFFNLS